MQYIIIDIETEVVNYKDGIAQPSVDDKLKLFKWKDDKGEKGYFTVRDLYHIQQKIKNASVIVGFNIKGYDIPILEKNGCSFNYKIIIDEYEVIKKHVDKIKILKDLDSYSLEAVAEALELKNQKQKGFDYKLLNGDDWEKNLPVILEYADTDIETEEELFLWLEHFFQPFKYGLTIREIEQYKYMTLKTSVYAYKIICRKAGIKEEYNENVGDYKGQYEGGFVAEPERELSVTKIVVKDLKSAYPHAYMQGNLFSNECSCCKDEEKYDGGHLFALQNKYCTKIQGVIENVIKDMFNERLRLIKEGNRTEYAIKILINVIYGICGNPAFKNVYNLKRAGDCTHMVRTIIQYVRKRLEEFGFINLYTDTDSIFIELNGHTEKELDDAVDIIIKEIKTSVTFPEETFKMPTENKVKLLYCPRKMKKNYLYVTEDSKLKVKGLKIIKVNNQKVSQVVFNKYIKPIIISELRVKFTGKEIKDWIELELQNDLSLATVNLKASNKEYKNQGDIHNQIRKKYGVGRHKLVPNFKYGVGEGVRLCTIEEFKIRGLGVKDINLQQAYNELQIFTDDELICKSMITLKGRKRFINTLEEWLI